MKLLKLNIVIKLSLYLYFFYVFSNFCQFFGTFLNFCDLWVLFFCLLFALCFVIWCFILFCSHIKSISSPELVNISTQLHHHQLQQMQQIHKIQKITIENYHQRKKYTNTSPTPHIDINKHKSDSLSTNKNKENNNNNNNNDGSHSNGTHYHLKTNTFSTLTYLPTLDAKERRMNVFCWTTTALFCIFLFVGCLISIYDIWYVYVEWYIL